MFEHPLFRTVDFFVCPTVVDGMPSDRGPVLTVGLSRTEWDRRASDPAVRPGVYLSELWVFYHVELLAAFVGERQFAVQAYHVEPDGSLSPVPYPPAYVGDHARAELPYDGPELRYNFTAGVRAFLHGSLIRRFYLPRLGPYRFVLYVREPLDRPVMPAERWLPVAQTEVVFECEP
jgi:hypothetical protein